MDQTTQADCDDLIAGTSSDGSSTNIRDEDNIELDRLLTLPAEAYNSISGESLILDIIRKRTLASLVSTSNGGRNGLAHHCDICKECLPSVQELICHRYKHSWDASYTCLMCYGSYARKAVLYTHIYHSHNACASEERPDDDYDDSNDVVHNGDDDDDDDYDDGEDDDDDGEEEDEEDDDDDDDDDDDFEIEDKPQNKPKCNICHRTFMNKAAIINHRKVHDRLDAIYTCLMCYGNFAEKIELYRHIRRSRGACISEERPKNDDDDADDDDNDDDVIIIGDISNEKPARNICDRTFTHRPVLLSHKQVHNRYKKPYKANVGNKGTRSHHCDICRKYLLNTQVLICHRYTHTFDTAYTCLMCSECYARKGELYAHICSVHDKPRKIPDCDICHRTFMTNSAFSNHRTVHDRLENNYKCLICNGNFTTKGSLCVHIYRVHDQPKKKPESHKKFARKFEDTNHKRVHHELKKQFTCETCDKQFIYGADLKKHIRIHTGEKPFLCDVCGKQYSHRADLRYHKRSHTESKRYDCSTCHKQFLRSKNLKRHIRIHEAQERPYKCDACDKCYPFKSQLTVHARGHMAVKPYNCGICGKGFPTNTQLKNHVRTHTGENPYKCDKCDKQYRKRESLVIHTRIHTGDKPYTCHVCGKGFYRNCDLKPHIQAHSGKKPEKTFVCLICDKRYALKQQLTLHMRTHTGEKPFKCNFCEKRCSGRTLLIAHTRTHTGERPYKCNTCDKRFRQKNHLTVHIRSHTGERPYKCQICLNSFSHQGILKGHMRTHARKK